LKIDLTLYWSIAGSAALLAFVVGETYALWTGGQTLSVFLRMLSAKFPPFVFMAGALAGHLWWTGKLLGK
jgi:hypothetical protein